MDEIFINKFWSRVNKTETCWNWTGPRDKKGYGLGIYNKGRQPRIHRQSYELNIGPIPQGLHVLHKCDNPSCVRPDHLFLGTNFDNIQDRNKKGRMNHAKGEQVSHCKLTPQQVLEIRTRPIYYRSYTEIAREFGVTPTAIKYIIQRRNWKHI